MKGNIVLLSGLMMLSGSAFAAQPCETNYKQEGNYFNGRRFTTWEEVSTPPAEAYRLIYADAVKSGLKIANADKEMGLISAEQNQSLGGSQVSLPWNIAIEAAGKGSKISVTKTTPSGYATDKDYQLRSMCSVIATARK